MSKSSFSADRRTPRTRTLMVAVVVGAALTSMPKPEAKAESLAPSPQTIQEISRYCQACWRNARLHPDTWQDSTQEVLARLLQTVRPDRWNLVLKLDETDERREFLRAVDAIKKRTQRAKKFSGLIEEVNDRRHVGDSARNELREELSLAAVAILTVRQQQILQLATNGWTVPEIAEELDTTVERVSDEKYKAIRKLRAHFEAKDRMANQG